MHAILHLDDDEWAPPPSPLTPELIQRGQSPIFPVSNEHATDPLTSELSHWSALPALSYFALNAVALREAARRIRPPSTFKPPPRVTLSDLRSKDWLKNLQDPRVPLRKLARTVPHGYSGKMLLTTMLDMRVPLLRAIWFIRCIGANEIRIQKRKAGVGSGGAERDSAIERAWLEDWTRTVEDLVSEVVDEFPKDSDIDQLFGEDEDLKTAWKTRMEYLTGLLMGLYNESLLDRQSCLDWLLEQLCKSPLERLPCFVHFVQLLWVPFTSAFMAPRLLKSLVQRLHDTEGRDHEILVSIVEPILFKLVSTNDNVFVTPRTWPEIEPYVRSHPGYARLVERNSAFMTKDMHDTTNWTSLHKVGRLMAAFARPYRLRELVASLKSLDISDSVLIKTILSRTIRSGTSAGNILGVDLLKRFRHLHPNLDIPQLSVEFLFELDPTRASTHSSALICDLIVNKLFNLGKYLNRLISEDLLFDGSPSRDMHLDVLESLPMNLPPSVRTQVNMMLQRSGVLLQTPDLDAWTQHAMKLLDKPSALKGLDVSVLHLPHRRRLADKLVAAFENRECAYLTAFCDLVDRASVGTARPLARLLCAALNADSPAFISAVLHEVHIRLMAFSCSGLIDTFTRKLVHRLETVGMDSSLSWDDVNVLRSVIQDPALMFVYNRLLPLRAQSPVATAMLAGETPLEHDPVRNLLHRAAPDITQLLNLRGTDGLAGEIVDYARTEGADHLTLLQLVAYNVISIADVLPAATVFSAAFDVQLANSLLLVAPIEFGFGFDENEALRHYRHEYLSNLEPREYLRMSLILDKMRFSSRVAHFYPDVFETCLVQPAIASPEFLGEIKKTFGEHKSFEKLLVTCTPFNLRFRQSLIKLKYHGWDAEDVAKEVLDAAYAHPSNSAALQGLLLTVSSEVKNLIFSKTVHMFLNDGLTSSVLAAIDVPFNIVGALSGSVHPPLHWDFNMVADFLRRLVEHVEANPSASRGVLRKALVLVLRISVVGKLNNLPMSSSSVPYLDKLLHLEMFADDHRMRTIIEDALRLVLRLSQPEESRRIGGRQQLDAGGGATDGLQLYSKSRDEYGPLPIWPFDLIEDVSQCQGNDAPVDLSLFEAYND